MGVNIILRYVLWVLTSYSGMCYGCLHHTQVCVMGVYNPSLLARFLTSSPSCIYVHALHPVLSNLPFTTDTK
jgi:hypothetical protein